MSKKANNKKRKNKTAYIISNIILVIAASVFIFSLVKLVSMLIPYYKGENDYKIVRELVVEVKEESGETEDQKFVVDFETLKQINPETGGWIRFDEPSIISYPIVKSKDNIEYLTKTFSENDNKLGSIFMDMNNSSEFNDKNTIIYGHNMAVGNQMFSRIREYGGKDFMETYPYFYIYTPDNIEHRYRVFAAGVVKEYADNYRISFLDDNDFESYLNLCKSSSNYDTEVELNKDSKIVTLSTCTCVNEDERFIIQGVLEE